MTDYEFIKEFRRIKMNDICKKAGVIQQNIVSGKTSDENLRKVKEEIIKELASLFTIDVTASEKIITLYLYNELLTKLEKENELLKEELTNLKNDITRVYNTMISLETINKQELEEVEEI